MSVTIAIVNQKGGVGKTTTAINLAASFAALNKSCLLIDLDSQANATTSSGVLIDQIDRSMDDVLLGRESLSSVVLPTPFKYDLAPASHAMSRTEWQLMQCESKELRLYQAIYSLSDKYDYIVIDAPPALNILSVNAILASDELLVPVQCEFLALEGLTKLVRTIQVLEQNQKKQIDYFILRTLFDGRIKLSKQISEELLTYFSDKVYHTVIPRSVRLAEAPSHSKPGLFYDASNQGTLMYLALASEILQRHNKNDIFSILALEDNYE